MLGPQTATIVEAVKPRPLRAVLRVHSPAAVPQEVQLGSSSCFIGSGLKNTIVLSDPSVSRAHAEIRVVPDGILVTDLGSRNGTFYAGQRVGEITFPFGAEIRIANVRVEIHADLEDLARTEPTPQAIFRGLIGVSEAMRQTFAMISRLDSSLAGILILGESGVGKELIARAIHEGSAAKTGPFVAVNCGAFQKELIASQLFGHKRGAFTGAVEACRRRLE